MTDPSEINEFTKDVFISYSTVDSDEVLDFVSILKNSGVEFFLDKMDIGWGESIIERVFSGIESARFVVVFISVNSLKSPWVKKEILTAFQREIETDTVTLLPVLSCSQSDFFSAFPFLKSKKYLHFDDKEEILQNLIELLRGKASRNFTFNHPRAYHGPVWIRFLAEPANDGVKHTIKIRWGPWYREYATELSSKDPVFCTHSKGNDEESIPIVIELDKLAYVSIGQGVPNSERRVDINPFWVDGKSKLKRLIAKALLWP
ncbi:toll/interleukin-1 receptor domain-containing protein [Candidatus Thiodiazotropha sp. CDECU1]|uniref:toll/interleukin-1 receptor domain-containing protein n=1 Tax=Candidatus Thiodiazotropha sp. CDECU1 TaxID=3065865 RepID=UPI002930FF24|nr:toll/interleukin-1 receptor domain-containing protein [Candidatus Thiodiazotropha sp. CDECU1]